MRSAPTSSVTTPTSLDDIGLLLDHQLRVLWSRPEERHAVAPLMLWGPPGVGKSSVVRAAAARHGVGFLDIRLSQREPVDLRGLPVPQNGVVEWLISSEWPRDQDSRGIILFDELTAADRSLQVAAYELILERRLGTLYTVPPGWFIVAAGNRAGDGAVAGGLSSALANRFCHVEVAVDVDDWVAWAGERGLGPLVPSFLRYQPEHFLDLRGSLERGWPSPRSWERVAVALAHAEGLPEHILHRVVEGLVGTGAAAAFMAFRLVAAQLADVDAWLRGEGPMVVPAAADQRFALVGAIATAVWRAPRRREAIALALEICDELGTDFAALLLTDLIRGRSAAELGLILGSPAFPGWVRRHGAAARGRLTRDADAVLGAVLLAGQQ